MIGCPIESNFIHTGNSMKTGSVVSSCAMTFCLGVAGLGLAGLTGCGGSSAPPPPPAASISSFASSAANITNGNSATLTGVFSNGTGVITPASSGTAVTVSPTATTTYTLTVTGSSGSPATSTATVTVYPVPAITSFVAASPTINLGASTTLTAVFANGTGVITPGNIAATSGTAVTVSPTATTTYTLTVTNGANTAVTSTVTVTVIIPPPTITSFVAASPTIVQGNSTTLTAVFANGTGVITPGNIAATSGVAVSVSPATTTKYTLTVTNSASASINSNVTVTVNPPPPSITSFVATSPTIAAGQSDTLTAVFVGGTAVITPGNITATSGVAVSVTPAATTTYTLTLTPTGGGATLTSSATITVNPPPTITSFAAAPVTITAGGSSTLTGVFANGAGVITGGASPIDATSGTGVSVTPAATTTYTLTVTPTAGAAVTATATVTVASSVTVDESTKGAAVTDQLIGMNMAMWYDPTTPTIQTGFASVGVTAVRWPGGSNSDLYNWETNTECNGYSTPNSNFTTFVNEFVIPAKVDLALTADYGTGTNCTGVGDPTEAAAWAAESVTLGATVSHMTVGNEEYGHWETDSHTIPNDPTTYAAAVAGTSGYYALIKKASPSTLVGVDVDAGSTIANDTTTGWDPIVMAGAPFDFVEYHYYPENPGNEDDTFLVQQAAQGLTTGINTIRTELTAAGKPADTPIYVGEMGSVSSNPGKQSWSITQGLYAGQVLGEMMNDGVSRATWWIGWGNCNGTGSSGDPANMSASLYGWQDFGAYNVFSDGSADNTCPGAGAIGTLSPTAVAFQLFSKVAVNGENVLPANVAGDTTDVRAYAATNNGGTALVLFNLNQTTPQSVLVTLSGQASSTGVTMMTYDKAIYDLSGTPTGTFPDPNGTGTWAPPTTTSLGAQTLPMTLTLSPWSMNVIIVK
jgi:hypothetical protein